MLISWREESLREKNVEILQKVSKAASIIPRELGKVNNILNSEYIRKCGYKNIA